MNPTAKTACDLEVQVWGRGEFLLNVGLTRARVPTATPEDDRGEKAGPRRYALLTLIRHDRNGGQSPPLLSPEVQHTVLLIAGYLMKAVLCVLGDTLSDRSSS